MSNQKGIPNFWLWPFNLFMSTPTEMKRRTVFLPDELRATHSAYFGASGTGKTSHIEGLAAVDAIRRTLWMSNRGFAIFDVHGDLGLSLINRLALLNQMHPAKLDGMVVVIDPTIQEWSVSFNPLALRPGEDAEERASRLTDAIITVFKDDPTVVVRMYRVLRFSLWTLIEARCTMLELPRLLTEKAFREQILTQVYSPQLERYWQHEFPKSDRDALEHSESTLNRIGRLVERRSIARMLAGGETFDFRKLIDSGAMIIIRVPKGSLGDDVAYLLCGLLLSEFQHAAFSREDTAYKLRTPFTLFCDEFVNYLTPAIPSIVSEGRKYGLELILATQDVKAHLKTDELLSSVLNSVGNLFAFRLGWNEADTLVRDLFNPELDQAKDTRYSYRSAGGVPYWEKHVTWRGLDEIWEGERRKITNLPKRKLWWKQKDSLQTRLLDTVNLRDVEQLPKAHLLPQLRAILLDNVRQHYGHARPLTGEIVKLHGDDIPEDEPVE